jgi:hypothetical protein
MGKGWVRTPEQTAYLDGEFQNYLKARKDGEVKNWRIKLHDKWEEHWPEWEFLANEWKLPGNTLFNTDQMAALGKALAARKMVTYSFISQLYMLLNGSFSSNCTTTFVGA